MLFFVLGFACGTYVGMNLNDENVSQIKKTVKQTIKNKVNTWLSDEDESNDTVENNNKNEIEGKATKKTIDAISTQKKLK